MEEVKNEEVTEEVIQENAPAEKQKPALNLGKFQSEGNDSVFKVDLSKPVEPKEVVDEAQTDLEESIEQAKQEEEPDNEVPALEEVTNEEPITEEKVMEALDENEDTGKEIPENVKKLMDFMDETGGDLNDYVNLNRDVSKLDSQDALREYYKKTKPHLDSEEINFLMEDNFSFDEDVDDERDIKRKKLALKEQVAEAKTYLDGQKSKYYEEIKAGSKLTTEQQNAVNFFDRYNKESEGKKDVANQRKSTFTKKTEQVFNNEFKGFDFEVGDKKFRYNVKDVNTVKESQSDINNFIGKFLDESSNMSDAKGYHKGLYTAMNPDSVAQHFYEQGKADALKSSVEKAKNVNVAPRQSHGSVDVGGVKYRVLGDSANDFKLRVKKRK